MRPILSARAYRGQGWIGTVATILRVRLLGLVICLVLLAAFPGAAVAEDEYAVPFDGYRQPVSSFPNALRSEMIAFTIYAPFADGEFEIEVATGPDADPDGTLADAGRVDAYVAPPDPRVTSEVFTAHTDLDAAWLATLGTYYWQSYRREAGAIVYATPVQRIVIVERPPPDAPFDPSSAGTSPAPAAATPPAAYLEPGTAVKLSRRSATTILRRVVRTQSGRRPRALVSRCTLPTSFLAECRLSWRDARHRYRVRARLESTAGGMLAELDGKRIRRACKRRCRSTVHWSIATLATAGRSSG